MSGSLGSAVPCDVVGAAGECALYAEIAGLLKDALSCADGLLTHLPHVLGDLNAVSVHLLFQLKAFTAQNEVLFF